MRKRNQLDEIIMPDPGLYFAKVPGKNYGLYLHQLPDLYSKLYQAVYVHNQESDGKLGIFYQSDSASGFEITCHDRSFRYYDRNDEFWKPYIERGYSFDELFGFLFVEFWCEDYDFMLKHSQEIAKELGVELKLEGWN